MATPSHPRAPLHVDSSGRSTRAHRSLTAGKASKLVAICGVVALSACAEVETPAAAAEKNPFEQIQPEPSSTRRVAQVKIALRSQAGALPTQLNLDKAQSGPIETEALMAPSVDVAKDGPPSQELEDQTAEALALNVRGDFAAFQGVQERLVWAFAGISEPAWLGLQIGDCMGVRASAQRALELNAAEAQGTREIELLDLGRFEIELGDQRFEVPLHLAPGVLPYASGVQYRGEQELAMPSQAQQALALGWEGLAQLPGSRLSAPVPAKLNFELYPSVAEQGEEESTWYDMVWSPTETKSRLFLHARLTSANKELLDGPQQSQVVCRLPDRGEWQLDLEELADEGLDIGAEDSSIEFELRRVQDFRKAVPGFERVQVQIERSESLQLNPNLD